MINFIKFAVSRYCHFCSHLAAFLAGLSLVLPITYFFGLFGLSVVLGSLSAYYRRNFLV